MIDVVTTGIHYVTSWSSYLISGCSFSVPQRSKQLIIDSKYLNLQLGLLLLFTILYYIIENQDGTQRTHQPAGVQQQVQRQEGGKS